MGKKKNQLNNVLVNAIIELMIIITHRKVLKEIHKVIWDTKQMRYQRGGISYNEMSDELAIRHITSDIEQNKFLKLLARILKKIKKNYKENDYFKLDDILNDLIKEDYLEETYMSKHYRISWRGKRFISKWYWIKEFTKHPLVLKVFDKLIPWAMMTTITIYALFKIL